MKKIVIITFFVALLSCTINEVSEEENDIAVLTEYSIASMLYPKSILPNEKKVKLNYNEKNQIVQRIGSLISINPMTGFSYKFYDYIGDTVKYYNDSIVITKQLISTEDFSTINEFKRKLIIKNNRVDQWIYDIDFYGKFSKDTLFYNYNNKGQIDFIIHRLSSSYKKIYKFNFDNTGNLNTVTGERIYEDATVTERDTAWFSDFDDTPNRAKNLYMFEECFYRSLSTNNFRKYIYKNYRLNDSQMTMKEERQWDFAYDENNYIIY